MIRVLNWNFCIPSHIQLRNTLSTTQPQLHQKHLICGLQSFVAMTFAGVLFLYCLFSVFFKLRWTTNNRLKKTTRELFDAILFSLCRLVSNCPSTVLPIIFLDMNQIWDTFWCLFSKNKHLICCKLSFHSVISRGRIFSRFCGKLSFLKSWVIILSKKKHLIDLHNLGLFQRVSKNEKAHGLCWSEGPWRSSSKNAWADCLWAHRKVKGRHGLPVLWAWPRSTRLYLSIVHY